MSQFAWPDQVATLNDMLNTLEAGVKPGDPSAAGLAEFKSALDDLRLRTWSLLSAVNADDPHAFQERFRAHRGTEMCRALTTDLRTGRLRSGQPDLPALGRPVEHGRNAGIRLVAEGVEAKDLPALGDAAKELSGAVKEATRKPPKGRGKSAR